MKLYMVPAGDDSVNVRAEENGRVYSFRGRIVSSELGMDYDDYGDFREPMLRSPRRTYTLELSVDEIQMTDVSVTEAMAQLFSAYPQRHVLGMDPPQVTVEEVPAVVEEVPEDIPSDWINLDGA